MTIKSILLFAALVYYALAQQQGDYGYGGYGADDKYQDYYASRQNDNDNLYANYAKGKAVGGVGWPKLLMAGIGGYIVGAKIHTSRLQKKMPKLRFKVKQRVECNMGEKWAKGTIVGLWVEQTEGQWMPYEVKLDDYEQMIFAPADTDRTIRAA